MLRRRAKFQLEPLTDRQLVDLKSQEGRRRIGRFLRHPVTSRSDKKMNRSDALPVARFLVRRSSSCWSLAPMQQPTMATPAGISSTPVPPSPTAAACLTSPTGLQRRRCTPAPVPAVGWLEAKVTVDGFPFAVQARAVPYLDAAQRHESDPGGVDGNGGTGMGAWHRNNC
jgi:hypothetical protein